MATNKGPAQNSLFGGLAKTKKSSLKDRFLMPPFSVLDARQGEWQDRKRSWIELGIESEVGRGDNLLKMSKIAQLKRSKDYYERHDHTRKGTFIQDDAIGKDMHFYYGKNAQEQADAAMKEAQDNGVNVPTKDKMLGKFMNENINSDKYGRKPQTGTSIFDPVLCELLYRWFSVEGDKTLDPFAGGSVRGIIGAYLGRNYSGIDLRPEQVEANQFQWEMLNDNEKIDGSAQWFAGDSLEMNNFLPEDLKADFILSCPPYADLEVYSHDPKDLSNMPYEQFRATYKDIIKKAVDRLENDRFAAWVVGEIRDKKTGLYRNFVMDTIQAFQEAGMSYYNEMILVTAIGTLPIRVNNFFKKYRKIGKTHQNILVFYKGNPDNIPNRYPETVID